MSKTKTFLLIPLCQVTNYSNSFKLDNSNIVNIWIECTCAINSNRNNRKVENRTPEIAAEN